MVSWYHWKPDYMLNYFQNQHQMCIRDSHGAYLADTWWEGCATEGSKCGCGVKTLEAAAGGKVVSASMSEVTNGWVALVIKAADRCV